MLLIAFLVLALLSAGLVAIMARVGVLDHPGPRSSHAAPIPKGGGVGIVAASLAGLAFLPGPVAPRLVFALGGLLVAAVGFWDDRHNFPPAVKLAAQIIAAALPLLCGVTLHLTASGPVNAVLLMGWLLLVTNAVNFMDGLNGLSAGTVLIAACGAGFPSLTIGLIAGIAGFLPFNYPRARIFMGDVGSQFIGYALGLLAVFGASGPHPWLVPFASTGLLADVIFTLIRRLRAGDRITQAHRGHLYQIAHRTGMPDTLIALVHWSFAAIGVALGLLPWHSWLITAVLLPQIAWALYVIWRARIVPIGRW